MLASSPFQALYGWLKRWRASRGIAGVLRAANVRLARFRCRRVPVVLQLTEVECGAACLAMILGYYGRRTGVSECRDRLGIGRDGVTAHTIARAARQYGLRVKAFSVDLHHFPYVQLPAIVHWRFNHFVIVERWSPTHVWLVDPALGRRRVRIGEFAVDFTGVAMTFEPGVQFDRTHRPTTPLWRYYFGFVRRAPGTLAQIVGASLLLQLLGLALPLGTKVVVDRVLPFQMTNIMQVLGAGLLVLVLAQFVTGYLRAVLLIYLQARLDSHMMLSFVEHMLTLPFRFFEQRTSGDLLMRLSSNAMIRETLTSQTMSIVIDGTLVLGYLMLLLAQAPSFGLLVVAVAVLQIVLLIGTTRRVHELTQRQLMAQGESQSYFVETLRGIATLKAAGSEDRVLDHWTDLFRTQLNASLELGHLSAVVDTAMNAVRMFAPIVLLWVGAQQVLGGSLSLGSMLAFNALAVAVLTPLGTLVANAQRLQLVGAYLERLADVLATEPEQELQATHDAPRLTGQIALQDVSFRYDPHSPLVLERISLAIKPGQHIAIVGRSGSGKSTLARLLVGLYTPTDGHISYDGIPLSQLNYRTVRSQCGVVLQESTMFSSSIRQNITFDAPDRPFEEIVRAAQLACLHDDIKHMPMGYETLVAEGGTALSGGQRQRLSLARALVRQPAILVLDEATSHLDVLTERLVDENISRLACTRVVIAHRLSTVRNADLIIVLDQGAIVEHGSHEELLARNGVYTALVQGQLGGAAVAIAPPSGA